MTRKKLEGGIIERYSTKVKNIMSQYGNIPIKSGVVTRTPIWGSLKKILYVITAGQSVKAHDEYFHLSVILTLEDNNKISIEKNAVINMDLNNFPEINKDTQYINIPNIQGHTINNLMENGRKALGNKKWFIYRPFEENCQHFIVWLLKGSNLLTTQLNDFIYQDMKKIIESVPSWVKKISDIVFDIANYSYYLKGGKKI